MSTRPNIFIGTRGSKLALWQTEHVQSLLHQLNPELLTEIKKIQTSGDQHTEDSLTGLPGKNVFVKEIEEALLNDQIDIAVHSLKDMSAQTHRDLSTVAYIGGAQRGDVLLANAGYTLANLPAGARIGTGSMRRTIQLKQLRPDLEILPIRGNLDTRIRKMKEQKYDAIVLAAAGLERLGYSDRITYRFRADEIVPAGGQGIIAVQCRYDDQRISGLLARINQVEAANSARIEFGFMSLLGASCNIPLGIIATPHADGQLVRFFLSSLDGKKFIRFNREYRANKLNQIPELVYHEVSATWKREIGEELDVKGFEIQP